MASFKVVLLYYVVFLNPVFRNTNTQRVLRLCVFNIHSMQCVKQHITSSKQLQGFALCTVFKDNQSMSYCSPSRLIALTWTQIQHSP